MQRQSQVQSAQRYAVNVLIDHSGTQGAPVVCEDNPTFQNLLGRIEHRAQMGALTTDFTLIKAGALHRANGGYLIVDADKLLMQPQAWEGLKRALRSRRINVESLGQHLGLVSTVSLEPEPIPLRVKVALIGDARLYHTLWALDPEFAELFKVAADFGEIMPRDTETEMLYARQVATIARREGMLSFDRGAIEQLLERSAHGGRRGEAVGTDQGAYRPDAGGRLLGARGLVTRLSVWPMCNARSTPGSTVSIAFESASTRRSCATRSSSPPTVPKSDRSTASVAMLGNYAFGQPSRITAAVSMRARVRSSISSVRSILESHYTLQRVLILTGYLSGRYAADAPLSLSASLVFGQSYAGVDGDSASSAELYTLLSAIAGVPIKQSYAVTGSISQKGEIQAIGGVNEKIEDFLRHLPVPRADRRAGRSDPAANVKHLMLRQDVVGAVAQERFHIYAIGHVDEGIEILTEACLLANRTQGQLPRGYAVNRRATGAAQALAKKTAGPVSRPGGDE